ncbi:MAG TPA: DsbA family protein [Dongiaceae bacterium]|nr:DsbA family protein [Dongiaceae bacterium]
MIGRLPALIGATLAVVLLAATASAQENETLTEQGKIEQIIHDYLLAHPEVIIEAVSKYQAQQEQAAAAAQARALVDRREELIHAPDAPVLGNPSGDVTIVEFFDYQCPYCKSTARSVLETVSADGNVRLVFKEFPILGPVSDYAAKAALAAQRQGKYPELHMALMAFKGKLTEEDVMRLATDLGLDAIRLAEDMEAPEIAASLARNHELAGALGVRGTPAFVIGDQLVPGAITVDEMRQRIAAARQG